MNRDDQVREVAARVFAQAADDAKQPGGRARSIWRRRIEPWLVTIASIAFIAWALWRVFLSR